MSPLTVSLDCPQHNLQIDPAEFFIHPVPLGTNLYNKARPKVVPPLRKAEEQAKLMIPPGDEVAMAGAKKMQCSWVFDLRSSESSYEVRLAFEDSHFLLADLFQRSGGNERANAFSSTIWRHGGLCGQHVLCSPGSMQTLKTHALACGGAAHFGGLTCLVLEHFLIHGLTCSGRRCSRLQDTADSAYSA
eukprot:1156641-Pelagomonas_calceolata.AAC.4